MHNSKTKKIINTRAALKMSIHAQEKWSRKDHEIYSFRKAENLWTKKKDPS